MKPEGAEIRNILDLCKDIRSNEHKPLYVNIPYYQRPYKWDDERVQNLIRDFYKNRAEQVDNMEYFVGSVVLVRKADAPMDIVDGQQRITTVFLLNFIRFLLLRAQVDSLIYRRREIKIYEAYRELIECYSKLVGRGTRAEQLEAFLKKLMNDGSFPEDVDSEEKDQKWEELLLEYRTISGLPAKENPQAREYDELYSQALYSYLEPEQLAVQYSRPSYNENLKNALAHVKVEAFGEANPKLRTIKYEGYYEGDEINRYIAAIESAFSVLKSQTQDSAGSSEQMADAITRAISEIVNNLQFCVVITGNEKDAYTLFEVLNDRAMEVDDLDLIKNLLYKTYCNNTEDTDEEIDDVIGKEDKRWGEKIFTSDMSPKRAKRISYFATIFLTGNTTIKYGSTEKYRETLERDYLEKLLEERSYGQRQLNDDIDVFEMVAILLDKFEILEARQNESAIKAQNDPNSSITCKAFRLFQALGQDGVASALVNIIIKTFRDNNATGKDPISDFTKYVEELKIRESEKKVESNFKEVHGWARKLWKASLMAKDYEIPREIARMLIQNVSEFKDNLSNVAISEDQANKLKKQFKEWTQGYQYGGGSSKDDIKVKILFHELLGTSISSGKLQKRRDIWTSKTDKLQLDHLEPENPNEDFIDFYYNPASQSITRENVVAGLGNMMLIDFETNKEMSNKPISLRLYKDYENQLQGHWLLNEAKEQLKANSSKKMLSDGEIYIPSDEFFTIRREQLQKSFLKTLEE